MPLPETRKSKGETLKTFATILGVGILGIAIFVVGLAGLALIMSWAWNFVVPGTFSGPELSFGGAFALLVVLAVIRGTLFPSQTPPKA